MGRMIVGAFDNIAVTTDADQDIWTLGAGANNKIKLHWFELYSAQTGAENLRLQLRRVSEAGGGAAVTEAKLDEDDGAITGNLTTLDTIPDATPGDVLAGYQWEQLGPLIFQPTPELRPILQESGIVALHLQTALAATINMSGFVVWEEI